MINSSPSFFSLPEILIETYAIFQPLYEKERLRFLISLSNDCPQNLIGDGEQIKVKLYPTILDALNDPKQKPVILEVDYKNGKLTFRINDQIIDISYGIYEEPLSKEHRNIVIEWQLKDIEMSDLLESLVGDLPKRIKDFDQKMEAKDYNQIKEWTHALKGVTGNFKMTELYEPLEQMDRELKNDPIPNSEFHKAYEQFLSIYRLIPQRYLHTND